MGRWLPCLLGGVLGFAAVRVGLPMWAFIGMYCGSWILLNAMERKES
jgi:hypothetical protein